MNMIQNAKDQVLDLTVSAYQKAAAEGLLPQDAAVTPSVEIPKDTANGDYTTTFCLAAAKALKKNPRQVAQILMDHMDLSGSYFTSVEMAGPGFLNFRLGNKWFRDTVACVEQEGAAYGCNDTLKGQKIMVEFVSANPTGPMHMGNARGGATGDCLAAVLDCAGYDVWREFYVNDAGNQIEKFGISLEARYLQIFQGEENVEFPEDGYHGDDIREHARQYAGAYGDCLLRVSAEERRKALVDYALPKNIAKMKTDMDKYRIHYDEWFLESRLHKDGELEEVIRILQDKGLTYENEGALWYKATKFGGEKDEVLRRQNGNPTYFLADIAYHRNKFEKRGFSRCIDVWGADHHGHVARMKGAMDAIGLDGDKLDIVLIQLVRLVRGSEVVRMSKRTGKAIQLADLLDEVPVDAARFLFNMREASSQMDFDLDLAVQQDSQNPVYYVQYAHARICSLFKKLGVQNPCAADCTDEELALLTAPEELELIRHISAFTNEIIGAAQDYNPARITHYVIMLANLFHRFYTACRIRGEEEHRAKARLALCAAVRTVIRNVLLMFNIDAPESM